MCDSGSAAAQIVCLGWGWSQGLGSGQHTHGGGQSQLSFPRRSQGQDVAAVPAGPQELSSLAPISPPFSVVSTGLQNRAHFAISHLPILPFDPSKHSLAVWGHEETALSPFWWVWDVAGRDLAGLLLSPSHAWQSKPRAQSLMLGWGAARRVCKGSSPASLFKCWPICWLGGTHSLAEAAALKSWLALMSVPSITIALIFDTWREDAPAREEFIKNTPLTRHQREPQRDSELEQRTKTFTEVLRWKKGKGKNCTNNSNKVSYKTRIKRHCWGKDDDSKKHQELRTQLANQIYTDSPWYLPTNRLSCRTSKKFKRPALWRWAGSRRADSQLLTQIQVLHQWDGSEARGLVQQPGTGAALQQSPFRALG